MNLYTNTINEFIGWTDGRNVKTGSLITSGDEKISGKSIRELLLNHLRKPFVVVDYELESVQRVFSSDTSRILWELDRDANADLLLLELPRKSAYTITTSYTSETRYTTRANISDVSVLLFTWDTIDDSKESIGDDNLVVTCIVTDGEQKKTTFPRNFSYDQRNDSRIDFLDYLTEGTNEIELKFTSQSTGSYISRRLIIEVILLELSCNFRYYEGLVGDGARPIPLDTLTLKRNDTNNNDVAHVYIFIDGLKIGDTIDIFAPQKLGDVSYVDPQIINNFSEGAHVIQIIATLTKNNKLFYSNILYYVFVNENQQAGTAGKYIPFKCSINSNNISFYGTNAPIDLLCLTTTQYQKTYFEWGYYTDGRQQTSSDITWSLEYNQGGINDFIKTIPVEKGVKPDLLEFIPNFYTNGGYAYLVAKDAVSGMRLSEILFLINKGPSVAETPGYTLKLSAFGKDNNSDTKDIWQFRSASGNNINVLFSDAIEWNDSSGWYNNSLRLHGVNLYAIIPYAPFTKGVLSTRKENITESGETIEFEFETEKVVDANNDILLLFGDENNKHITVRPNRATLYDGNTVLLETNYKTNERLKLCFIINRIPNSDEPDTVDSGLTYIVNNGILERARLTGTLSTNSSGSIKIGGSNSGLKLYSIRCYPTALSYDQEYNNFVYDSDDKTSIINRNDILENGVINFEKCKERMDTILIRGDIPALLASKNKELEMNVTIERYCPSDENFNFTCTNCRIRKHGQSTLNYPVPSMKFWLNKSVQPDSGPSITPTFICKGQTREGQLPLGKNRYKMKSTSIPSNKFVLLANYADSSGVHNGGIMRAIQDSWYNAQINTGSDNTDYKLRTDPQLFATNLVYIREDGTISNNGKTWENTANTSLQFPYKIEVAPDSFPCVVFYEDINQGNKIIFLGQYVFMEDKKSDFCFGERSIYNVPTDPFCLTVEHANEDTSLNLVWDNKNVIRIEGVEFNTTFSSFVDYNNENGRFDQIIQTQASANSPIVKRYNWESDFELIYPDPDDIEEKDAKNNRTKFDTNSKYVSTVLPWINFYKWVTDTRNNYNHQTDWWNAGTYQTPQAAFEATAALHLDLYKLAAYYITYLRLGLVDSVERNAQYKTYDGQHWHLEPWDMDIALGNINTGGIEFNPPIDRTTMDSHGASAFAGGGNPPRNWLWNALEAWDNWSDVIVPEVARALDQKGFNYTTLTKIFDEDYQNKWCERIYNESCYYKYIIQGDKNLAMLAWLQGARTTHRHWWLNASMNFYDSKWGVGDFIRRVIRSWTTHDANDPNGEIIINPNERTFFKLGISNDGGSSVNPIPLPVSEAFRNLPFEISLANKSLGVKSVLFIYGASYIEDLDISSISLATSILFLDGAYSSVSGPSLRKLNIGSKLDKIDENTYTGKISTSNNVFQLATSDKNNNIPDVLTELTDWNIQGQNIGTTETWIRNGNYSRLKNFYSKGSRILNFYSSEDGNNFGDIELSSKVTIGNNNPEQLNIINLKDSSWENLSFWETVADDSGNATITRVQYNGENAVPASIKEIRLSGTTASKPEALQLIRGWIDSIKREEVRLGLEEYSLFGSKILLFENLKWNGATYSDIEALSKFNNGENQSNNNYGGIIILDNSLLTNEQVKTIRDWFGENVFTKKSKFAIDSKYDEAIINVGDPAYLYTIPEGGMLYTTATGRIVNLQEGTLITVLQEGNMASLNATKFGFLESDSVYSYTWSIGMPESAGGNSYEQCEIKFGDDGQYYLKAGESNHDSGYFVELNCAAVSASNEIVIPTPIVIYITSVIYPSSTSIECYDTNSNTAVNDSVRNYLQKVNDSITDSILIPSTTPNVEFYVKLNYENQNSDNARASIQYVTFLIKNEDTQEIVLLTTNYSQIRQLLVQTIDDYITLSDNYSDDPEHQYSICLKSKQNTADDQIVSYILTATIIFSSAKRITLQKRFMVMKDNLQIFNPNAAGNNTALSNILVSKYQNDYGISVSYGIMFKIHLMSICGVLDFGESAVVLNNLRTLTNDSVCNYLSNVTSLIFDNCTRIDTVDESIKGDNKLSIRLDKMINLTTLSLAGCSGLNNVLDFANNTSLQNFTLTNSGVTDIINVDTSTKFSNLTLKNNTNNLEILSKLGGKISTDTRVQYSPSSYISEEITPEGLYYLSIYAPAIKNKISSLSSVSAGITCSCIDVNWRDTVYQYWRDLKITGLDFYTNWTDSLFKLKVLNSLDSNSIDVVLGENRIKKSTLDNLTQLDLGNTNVFQLADNSADNEFINTIDLLNFPNDMRFYRLFNLDINSDTERYNLNDQSERNIIILGNQSFQEVPTIRASLIDHLQVSGEPTLRLKLSYNTNYPSVRVLYLHTDINYINNLFLYSGVSGTTRNFETLVYSKDTWFSLYPPSTTYLFRDIYFLSFPRYIPIQDENDGILSVEQQRWNCLRCSRYIYVTQSDYDYIVNNNIFVNHLTDVKVFNPNAMYQTINSYLLSDHTYTENIGPIREIAYPNLLNKYVNK